MSGQHISLFNIFQDKRDFHKLIFLCSSSLIKAIYPTFPPNFCVNTADKYTDQEPGGYSST